MINLIWRWMVFYLASSFISIAFAAKTRPEAPQGLGLVAQNLMEPVSVFSDFIQSACLILGCSFLIAAIIKYNEHRRSPLMVPISTVIFLIIAGIILILLPFLSLVTGNGVPYSLFK